MNKLIKTTSIIFFILFLYFVSIPKILADGSEKFTKSKSATGLDENFDTKITLLLNKSGENNNTIDLLFLTDIEIYNDVTGSNMVNEMYNMISNINSSDSIKATISLVLYGMDADKIIEYVDTKDITSKEDLVNRIEAKRDWINSNSFGSNMERALLLVKNMLASSPSNNNPEDRHIILLTNGNTLSYNNADGDSATTVFDGGSFYLNMSTMDSNGDAANKIGTYTVAIAAKYHNIPFYVAAPLSTIDTNIQSGDEIIIEERSHDEVTHINGKTICAQGVNIINPGFDVTPHELITGIITEKGILKPDYKVSIKKAFEM